MVVEAGRTLWPAVRSWHTAVLVLRRPNEDAVVGVGLHMLLQVLRTLEGFAAEITLVWLKRNMDANMRSDVVTLHCGGAA